MSNNSSNTVHLFDSSNKFKSKANKLFVSEGAKHDLSIRTDGRYVFSVVSTSGTCFFTGDRKSCEIRINELMTFAMHGY